MRMLLSKISCAFIPFLILLGFAAMSALLSYGLLQLTGDVISLRKVVSRMTQIFLLLSIFPLRRYLQLSWHDVGFSGKSLFFKQLGYGLVLGLLTLLPVIAILYALNISVFDVQREWTVARLSSKLALSLLLGFLIALGEEPLFTGILLAGLQKKFKRLTAAIITALYYSAFHFVKTRTHIEYDDLNWFSGFQLIGEAFANVLNPEIITAFAGLFAVGLFLALLRTRWPQAIGLCIGCHAGWVCLIKTHKSVFNTNADSPFYFFVSDYYDGIVGPLVMIWLLLACVVLYGYRPGREAGVFEH